MPAFPNRLPLPRLVPGPRPLSASGRPNSGHPPEASGRLGSPIGRGECRAEGGERRPPLSAPPLRRARRLQASSTILIVAWLFGSAAGYALQSVWVPIVISGLSVLASVFVLRRLLARRLGRGGEGLASPLEGARRVGAYDLLEPLGRGGMGEVWRAWDRRLERPVAVKLLRPREGASRIGRSAARRFEREALVTASLGSLHTIRLHDFGVAEDGTLYYVMEKLEGCDLATFVTEFGPMSSARVAHVLRQVLDSLGEAHARGLVHRDIKPANLFLSHRAGSLDHVTVLDFGLVQVGHGAEALGSTAAGTFHGTPAFVAPEQASDGEVDGRADLYALGCVAYFLLTGCFVFTAPTPVQVALKHVREEPEPPSRRIHAPIDPDLEALVMGLLRKDPALRPQDAASALRLLDATALPRWEGADARRWWSGREPIALPEAA
ncbi:MAG: serine/threonine protein kinase [Myxococcales bacterium]|nr:serine/threonine protein kinase [Myxococcales bacterium]